MNIEFDFITPFYLGAKDIFEQMFNTKVNVSQISNIDTDSTIEDVTVDLEIRSNNFTGKVYYFMSKEFVANILKTMMGDMMPIDLDSEMTKSALLELNNMVTGRALTKLADMGLIYNMSVPEILVGKGTQISEGKVSLSLVTLDSGNSQFVIGFLTSSVEKLVRPKANTSAQVKQPEINKHISVSTVPLVKNNKTILSQITEITLASINEIKDIKGDAESIIKKAEILTKLANNTLKSNHIPEHSDNHKMMTELQSVISNTLEELKPLKGNADFILRKNVCVADLAKVMLDILLEIVS